MIRDKRLKAKRRDLLLGFGFFLCTGWPREFGTASLEVYISKLLAYDSHETDLRIMK
jgi:hypothetical protein